MSWNISAKKSEVKCLPVYRWMKPQKINIVQINTNEYFSCLSDLTVVNQLHTQLIFVTWRHTTSNTST